MVHRGVRYIVGVKGRLSRERADWDLHVIRRGHDLHASMLPRCLYPPRSQLLDQPPNEFARLHPSTNTFVRVPTPSMPFPSNASPVLENDSSTRRCHPNDSQSLHLPSTAGIRV